MPQLRALLGLMGGLSLAILVGVLGTFVPQRAAAAQHALGRFDVSMSAFAADSSESAERGGVCSDRLQAKFRALVPSLAANAPEAAVSSTPTESQHPEVPVESPESGMGSIESGDDLNDFDDFAHHLRVVFDGTARLNREVERGVSLGGRALSRLEDNRSDKPPRG